MKKISPFLSIIFFSMTFFWQSETHLFPFETNSTNSSWSVYVNFKGLYSPTIPTRKYGDKTISYQKLNDSLYLQIFPIYHTEVNNGQVGYGFGLSKDAEGTKYIKALNVPRHGISQAEVCAFNFRNSDNTGPNQCGPKNVNAPGALRTIEYENFVLTIRVLECEITNLGENKIPAFSSIHFLITVAQK